MSKIIALTQGKEAIVDDEDYKELSRHKWCYDGEYASGRTAFSNHKKIRMHQEIMRTPHGMYTDHINGDKLDNRRENLRICSNSENIQNQKIRKNNTSGYKGVTWDKQHQKWCAQIKINYKHYHLGLFENPVDAAKAHDKAARKYCGEFAHLNFSEAAT